MNAPARDAAPLAEWEGRPVSHWAAAWGIPQLLAFARIASTNDALRTAGAAGAPAGTVALADFQTRGRGRLGRAWEAPAGRALLLSVLLRPARGGQEAAGALPLRIGLAIADAIEALTGSPAALKWPNDVQLAGRKVAGILCEAAGDFVVAGIGINVAQSQEEFPVEVSGQATSLLLATGAAPTRPELAGAVLARLRAELTAPLRPLDAGELARFAARDALAGRAIAIDDVPAGTAHGIDPLGALRVRSGDAERLVHAGTVRSLP